MVPPNVGISLCPYKNHFIGLGQKKNKENPQKNDQRSLKKHSAKIAIVFWLKFDYSHRLTFSKHPLH
jgi:hypothetical protein